LILGAFAGTGVGVVLVQNRRKMREVEMG